MLSIHSIAAEAAACHRAISKNRSIATRLSIKHSHEAISKIKNIKEDLAFLLGLPFCIIP